MRHLVIGIDPGTGVKSPLGVVAFDPATKEIVLVAEGTSKRKPLRLRLQDVLVAYQDALAELAPKTSTVFIEQFVMQGKGGETLQRLIGATLFLTPEEIEIFEVNNKQVKLCVGGSGSAEKLQVAEGVARYFRSSPKSREQIKALILAERWDVLDAFAIAITGLKTKDMAE